jgi:hypothetical protein
LPVPRAVPGRSLDDSLHTRRPFGRLLHGIVRKVAQVDCQGGKVDVWLRIADFKTGRTRLSVALGEHLRVQALRLEALPGWQSLNSIEGAMALSASPAVDWACALQTTGRTEPRPIGFTSGEDKGSTLFFRLPVYPEVLPFPAD